ncbi:MAG: DUF3598 family protein [Pseudomonadota bacterium]
MRLVSALFCTVTLSVPSLAQADEVADLIDLWTGMFDTAHQVQRNAALSDALPGRVDALRTVTVTALPDSALGANVILLEERKAGETVVHRQRLHRLVDEGDQIRVQQLFFTEGPVYDRPETSIAVLSAMGSDDVDHVARCDLFLKRTEDRFEGSIVPQRYTYEHPRGGEVWAEFEMVINASGYAYRDRSVILESGSPKGEIEDFAWLRFERQVPGQLNPEIFPALSRQLGTWEGVFHRISPEGETLDRFPTRITARLDADGTYHQTNTYNPDTAEARSILSQGRVEGAHLIFENDRVSGKAFDIDANTSVFTFAFSNGQEVREIVSLSPDGLTRHRATQYLKDGALVRRTLINERKAQE